VTVHVSPGPKSVSGSSVNVVGPPLATAVCAPVSAHEIVNHEPVTFTGSLKVIETFALRATLLVLFAGLLEATVGAASPGGPAPCEPSPPNVSVAKPSHSTAGSNASPVFVSPASIAALRRSVLSAVLVRPVPHSVPGSLPTWPIESITVAP
jgi:hypothetical protein